MRKRVVFVGIAIAAVTASVAVWLLAQNDTQITGDPDYQTVLPNNTSIQSLGGWTKVSPEESDPAYAYTDNIDGVSISVSQQPVPDSFQLAETAKGFNATEELDASGTKVYLGTSAKGPQSIIFTKKNLLILIKSQSKISNESWIKYINTLN